MEQPVAKRIWLGNNEIRSVQPDRYLEICNAHLHTHECFHVLCIILQELRPGFVTSWDMYLTICLRKNADETLTKALLTGCLHSIECFALLPCVCGLGRDYTTPDPDAALQISLLLDPGSTYFNDHRA
jgi:hypothetical protein